MTLHGLEDTYELANGVKIPVIGFGTWQTPDGDVAQEAVETALNAGYRHIDTAELYGNEAGVGTRAGILPWLALAGGAAVIAVTHAVAVV